MRAIIRLRYSLPSLLPLSVLLMAYPIAAHSCPVNSYGCRDHVVTLGYPKTTETCYYGSSLPGSSHDTGRMSYNWPAGFFQCLSWARYYSYMILGAEDEFTVTGVEPGSALDFTANLALTSRQCGNTAVSLGFSRALLRAEPGAQMEIHYEEEGCTDSVDTLRVVVQVAAGEPFHLHIEMETNAGYGGSATLTGFLRFEGLPEGAVLNSCWGYIQEFPVQVEALTWGNLKAIYH